jgi:hypothetical protein
MLRVAAVALVTAGSLFFPLAAHAGSVLFTGTGTNGGVTLNASAEFVISGSTLTVTLRNTGDSTGTSGTDSPAQTLSGVFFDLPTGITVTPVSAISPLAIVQASSCTDGPCGGTNVNVGGEFIYATGNYTSGGHLGDHGISSSGYISGDTGNFNGPNLDDPDAPNGINFGIIADITSSNKFKPNGGLSGRPLIEDTVVFTMTIAGGTLTTSQISNVSFQYGTGFGEPHFGGTSGGGGTLGGGVPEPAMLLLVAPAFFMAARRRRSAKSRR